MHILLLLLLLCVFHLSQSFFVKGVFFYSFLSHPISISVFSRATTLRRPNISNFERDHCQNAELIYTFEYFISLQNTRARVSP